MLGNPASQHSIDIVVENRISRNDHTKHGPEASEGWVAKLGST